jgi:hypothetical protein
VTIIGKKGFFRRLVVEKRKTRRDETRRDETRQDKTRRDKMSISAFLFILKFYSLARQKGRPEVQNDKAERKT